MTPELQTEKDKPQATTEKKPESESEKVLCPHCLRTATNGIKCQGICVSDDGY
ncbi:MAG: hypothetical protein KME10_03695 [Plectolyngbya sp. WJT66-NPBG17]|jgi:hypothetical protein|nr:hypothetical protein [Plectolyngbya sp. WJT66-NPBG17]MBW4526140.1 hypothetical protein [Phormidium tanganyikae FI6-MK23]